MTFKCIELEPGVSKENFSSYAKLVKATMETYNIPKVPVLAAEDETVVVGLIRYH